DQVTLTQTVEVDNNFTITKGTIALGNNHIRMIGSGAFVNNSSGYTSSGEGYLILETAAQTYTIKGTKPFSNIDIRDGAIVNTAGNVSFSGIMNIRKGSMNVLGGHTFTYTKDLKNIPLVKIWTDGVGTFTNAGTVAVGAGVVYDLYYTGDAIATGGAEWLAAGINNLTIATGGATPNARTITAPAATATSLAGVLTVNSKQTLALTGILTMAGDSKVHSILGKVLNNSIDVTGKGVVLNGSTATADDAEIPTLTVSTAAGESFTSNNLKKITGNLTVANGTASVYMNATTATITGNVTLTDGTLDLNMASTTSTHSGNLVLTKGTMTYTRGSVAAQQNIGGIVTLIDGTLNLGSNVDVTGATTQVAGNLVLGNHNYTQKANYTRTGAGTVTGNGFLILSGTLTVAPGATFKVPNLEMIGAITFGAAMEVTNALTHTSGAVNYSSLTFSGNTYNYKAGTITGSFTLSGPAVVATFYGDVTIPTLTVNSAGFVTIKSDKETGVGATARTITVGTLFTQTKGDVNLGINTFDVTGFTRTTGNWTQGTGYLIMNAPAPTLGTGFAIDNLEIPVAVTAGTAAFTVNKNLVLKNSLTTSADGKLTLGDNILIERQSNGAILSKLPTFGARTNLKYTTSGAAINAAKEMPSTIESLTCATTGGDVVLAVGTWTINGTLSLTTKLDATLNDGAPSDKVKVVMADGSVLELKNDGTTVLDENLNKAGAMDIVYNGATNTTTRELGPTTNATTHTATNVTVKGGVLLDASATFTGTLTLNGGTIDLNAKSLYLAGDYVESTNHSLLDNIPTGVLSKLYFSGATNTLMTLKQSRTVDPKVELHLAKTNINNTVTLSGGNIDMVDPAGLAVGPPMTGVGTIYLDKGALITGTNIVILEQAHTSLNQPYQGFNKTSGVIVGNVKKYISNQAGEVIDRSVVEFPTGTVDGNYRLASIFFNTAPQSAVTLTVNHINTSPGGTNGIPINTGTVTITNYPDFHWDIRSDMPIDPGYKFNIELQAEGYTDYVNDKIQNVRLIRRGVGNINNPWVLQGADAGYDNSTIAVNWPVVKVTNAEGGLTTNGCLFSYSQSDKTPTFTVAPATVSVDEVQTLKVEYKATDADINQTPTISVVGTLPSFASFATVGVGDSAVVTLAPTYTDAGTYTIKLRATDGTTSDTASTVITVNNVNQPPAFTTVPADVTMDELTAYTFTYLAADGDGETVYYAVVDSPATDVAITSAGVVTFTIGAGLPAGQVDTLVVSITDKVDTPNVFVNDTLLITVVKQVAPVYTAVLVDQTVNTGDTVAFTYTATDANTPIGDVLTFAIVDAPEGASIAAATGVFEWVVANDQVGDLIPVVVSVTDKTDKAVNDTAYVNVKSAVLGDASLNGAVSAYDASLVLQHVAGLITMTGDSLTLADATQNGTVSALDASYILQKVAGDTTLFKGGLAKALFSTGEISWEVKSTVNQEVLTVPMLLTSAKNVYSVEYTAEVDPFAVEIANVAANLPKDWQMVKNIKNGVLTVAMAGITPLTDAQIASIELRILSQDAAVMMTGSATVNENAGKSLKKLEIRQIPAEFKLSRNYPNPFNPNTNISFQLPENSKVTIAVYDILGNRVRTLVNENKTAGYYTVQWNGLNDNGMSLSSGTYFYQIQAGQYNSTKKMLLIK
ncbi:MAG: T9SS type A sorting domain-containing protein, partial [Candidatus Marinimicrobia bacterium]|nr:T9SS type A sorting domain-containing protein [Candidatus Neomarinimicrobiota bacterium]